MSSDKRIAYFSMEIGLDAEIQRIPATLTVEWVTPIVKYLLPESTV